ncbi:MAG: lysine--tRNA ligase [Acidimicrobiales bacterium]
MAERFDPPYRFPGSVSAASVVRDYGRLEAGEASDAVVRVAGRVMLLRRQGKIAFGELRDQTGAIQLYADAGETDRFDEFVRINLGDWIGAEGTVMRTKRGELSVKVKTWTYLARARRGFGDKWRGVHDVETRFRQREVDLWANEGVRETFVLRSRIVAAIRRELDGRGFLEVETPVLLPIQGGAHAKPFLTHYNALHADFYLRIATELYLKRLLVGGFERVYEIGRIFRNEGLSPRHNPEFTMLEAYQAYADYTDMMELAEQLVSGVAEETLGSSVLTYQGRRLDVSAPWRRATMDELVSERVGKEIDLSLGADELRSIAKSFGVDVDHDANAGVTFFALYEELVEPTLWEPVHVTDYPKEVSPLARDHRSRAGYVERFESVIAGREIVNAFSELSDPDEQRTRLEAQAAAHAAGDEEAMLIDEEFLRALEHGMPPTGGIGVGVDRIVMLLADKSNIKEVLLFPALRPESESDRLHDNSSDV